MRMIGVSYGRRLPVSNLVLRIAYYADAHPQTNFPAKVSKKKKSR